MCEFQQSRTVPPTTGRVALAEQKVNALGIKKDGSSPLARLQRINPEHVEITMALMFGLALTIGGAASIAFAAHAGPAYRDAIVPLVANKNVAHVGEAIATTVLERSSRRRKTIAKSPLHQC